MTGASGLAMLIALVVSSAAIGPAAVAPQGSSLAEASAVPVTVRGHIGGLPGPMDALDDGTVVAGLGSRIVVFDGSDQWSPATFVAETHLAGGPVAAVHARDGRALVGTASMVHLVDLSDPEHPAVMASAALDGVVADVALAGDHAYALVTSGAEAILRVIEISNDTALLTAMSIAVGMDSPIRVVAGDGVLAVLGWSGDQARVLAVDLEDPDYPVVAGRLTIEMANETAIVLNLDDVAIRGRHAYVAARERLLDASLTTKPRIIPIDLSDPKQPQLADDIEENSSSPRPGTRLLQVADDSLHVMSRYFLDTYELSPSGAPARGYSFTWFNIGEVPAGLAASKVQVFIATEEGRLHSIGTGVLGSYQGFADYPEAVSPGGIATHDEDLLVVDYGSGQLQRYSLGADGAADETATIDSGLWGLGFGPEYELWDPVEVVRDRAYVAGREPKIVGLDDGGLTLLGEITSDILEGSTKAVAADGSLAYLASDSGIQVFDVSEPSSPAHLGGDSEGVTALAESEGADIDFFSGSLIHASSYSYEVHVFDVGGDGSVVVKGLTGHQFESGFEFRPSVTVSGGRAYWTEFSGLSVADVTQPAAVHDGFEFYDVLWQWETPVPAHHVTVRWPYVFLTDMHDLHVLDASSPDAVHEVATYRHGSGNLEDAWDTFAMSAIDGSRVYVANLRSGVHILDIGLPPHNVNHSVIYLPAASNG